MTEEAGLAELRARYRDLAAQIAQIGFTASGTVLSTRNACGTAGCSCHADPARRHRPSWQHTRKVSGKTVTRRLSAAQAALYAEWIRNGRSLGDLLAQMQQVSDKARNLILATSPDDQKPARQLPEKPNREVRNVRLELATRRLKTACHVRERPAAPA